MASTTVLRTAGFGALTAALAHIVLFPINTVLSSTVPDNISPGDARAYLGFGAFALVGFGVWGVASIIAVSALSDAALGSGTLGRAFRAVGLIGGGGLAFGGATNLAQYGMIPPQFPDTGADAGAQAVAYLASYITVNAFAIGAAVLLSTWLVAFAVSARRAGVTGMPTTIVAAALGLLGIVATATTGFPAGAITVTVAFTVLAVVFLVRAARQRGSEVAGDTPVVVARGGAAVPQ